MVRFASKLPSLTEVGPLARMGIRLEELEHVGIFHFMVPFDAVFCVFESLADLLALKE